jgi:hypothetical protein
MYKPSEILQAGLNRMDSGRRWSNNVKVEGDKCECVWTSFHRFSKSEETLSSAERYVVEAISETGYKWKWKTYEPARLSYWIWQWNDQAFRTWAHVQEMMNRAIRLAQKDGN